MSKEQENPPAFPSGKSETQGFENSLPYYEGMTLRDYFAAKAMQGLWAQTLHEDGNNELLSWRADVYLHQAHHCYEMADAMLTARKDLP